MKRSHLFLIILCFTILSAPFSAFAVIVEVTANVAGCGDGIIAIGEQCDGGNMGGASCSSLGFGGGTLSCTSVCTLNTSLCGAPSSSTGGSSGPRRSTTPRTTPSPASPLGQVVRQILRNAPNVGSGTPFSPSAYLGIKNSAVAELQRVLARDPSIYPEQKVTGYFGTLTKRALERFQLRYTTVRTTVNRFRRARLGALALQAETGADILFEWVTGLVTRVRDLFRRN